MSSVGEARRIPPPADLVARLGARIPDAAARVERLPQAGVLAGFVLTQWAIIAGIAATVRHSGWIYYQGGDQLWHYTTAWELVHRHMPWPGVGYFWSILLAPIALVSGPNAAQALPAVVILDVGVLLPIAVLCIYGIAARIGGRLFGYWTALLWLFVPVLGILFTNPGYHQRYTELQLPQALGLTAMADFPVLVAILVSAYFAVRTLFDAEPRLLDGVAAGLAAGAAIAIKPSAALYLAGPALAYLVTRRWRAAASFAVALAPALVTLAFWKWRGFGQLPVGTPGGARLAAGTLGAVLPHFRLGGFSWSHFTQQLDLLREYFWSGRLIEWFVVAGVVGLFRLSRPATALVGGWFGIYVAARMAHVGAGLQDGSVLRLMIPAFPAFVLLLASIPFLLPGLARSARPAMDALPGASPRVRAALVAAGVLLTAIVPIAAIAAARSQMPAQSVATFVQVPAIPVGVDLGLHAARTTGGRVELAWRPQHPAGGPVFFHVYREPAGQVQFSYCEQGRAASRCYLNYTDLGDVTSTRFVDDPGKGRWRYRVGVAANWLDDPTLGDVYLISSPVVQTVG